MKISEKNRLDLINNNIEKAFETQKEVKFLIRNSYYSLSLNRVYYSMFYIISALALKNDFSTANHSQLIGWFNKNFVKEKKVDRSIGKMVYKAFEQRTKSDYNVLHKFNHEDAIEGLNNLNDVLQVVNKLINN
ncbi:MAG: HEPN domain-containing protein [Candidatus Cloacimonetes bacterium]|nr:HEPN domain-containing protein [Candidatus Cloacimonadota bacterium]